MDEQPQERDMPRGGIRKFMNDPKSSVMSYLAENLAAQQLQQQQANRPPQTNSSYGQQYGSQGSSGLSSHFQTHSNPSQTSLTPSHNSNQHSASNIQSSSYQPAYLQPGQLQPGQSSQIPAVTPYGASNAGKLEESSAAPQSGPVQSQEQQNSQTQELHPSRRDQGAEGFMTNLGKTPPTSGLKSSASAQSAPRLYHRMNLDFEATKVAFFAARAQHNSQEMTSRAYDLESLSQRIWTLRFEHAREFEGFQESGHQAIIANWQAQYELWADTVLDIKEGDSAASMFSIHPVSTYESTSLGARPSMEAGAPINEVAGSNLYGQPQQPTLPPMANSPHNPTLMQGRQYPEPLQNPMGQKTQASPNLSMEQGSQTSTPAQYPPPAGTFGGSPSAAPPSTAQNLGQHPVPFQQQPMGSPPPQMGSGSSGRPPVSGGPPPSLSSGQTVPPSGPNGQGMPLRNQSDVSQGHLQSPPAQGQFMPSQEQVPPQRQQMQGVPPSKVQQPPYVSQRPATGPPSNDVQPWTQMPQMGPGQNQLSRPNPDFNASLQPGGR